MTDDPGPVINLPQVTWAGLGLGLAAIAVGLVLGLLIRLAVLGVMRWRGRGQAAAAVFSRLGFWLGLSLGLLAALAIVFPSVRPVDILGGVGVVSIAAGIAFQTVLGNMFAGIVMLARDKFRVGDQIQVDDHRGTIVAMGLTSTSVRTFDGRLVLIPNAVLHSQVVTVQTGFEQVRTTVRVDVDDAMDLPRACRIAEAAMLEVASVLPEPAPRALLTDVGTTTVGIDLRFWSGATQLETKAATHAVIAAVLSAFRRNGVDTGSDVVVIEPGPRMVQVLEETPQDRD